MNARLQHHAVLPRPAACKDCSHAIRQNKRHDMVVCVPHLKNMPSNNTHLCELYSMKPR